MWPISGITLFWVTFLVSEMRWKSSFCVVGQVNKCVFSLPNPLRVFGSCFIQHDERYSDQKELTVTVWSRIPYHCDFPIEYSRFNVKESLRTAHTFFCILKSYDEMRWGWVGLLARRRSISGWNVKGLHFSLAQNRWRNLQDTWAWARQGSK